MKAAVVLALLTGISGPAPAGDINVASTCSDLAAAEVAGDQAALRQEDAMVREHMASLDRYEVAHGRQSLLRALVGTTKGQFYGMVGEWCRRDSPTRTILAAATSLYEDVYAQFAPSMSGSARSE